MPENIKGFPEKFEWILTVEHIRKTIQDLTNRLRFTAVEECLLKTLQNAQEEIIQRPEKHEHDKINTLHEAALDQNITIRGERNLFQEFTDGIVKILYDMDTKETCSCGLCPKIYDWVDEYEAIIPHIKKRKE